MSSETVLSNRLQDFLKKVAKQSLLALAYLDFKNLVHTNLVKLIFKMR
jgi:hypothetical protein